MTTTTRNEAAERLLDQVRDKITDGFVPLRKLYGQTPTDRDIANFLTGYLATDLMELLTAERRATVERIRGQIVRQVGQTGWQDFAADSTRLVAILDEEAAR